MQTQKNSPIGTFFWVLHCHFLSYRQNFGKSVDWFFIVAFLSAGSLHLTA